MVTLPYAKPCQVEDIYIKKNIQQHEKQEEKKVRGQNVWHSLVPNQNRQVILTLPSPHWLMKLERV